MLVPLLLTLVTFAAAVAGAITPLADSTAGKIVVCALMLVSAALTVAIEYRKGLEDEASRRELGQLVSLAEPPPQLMQDLRDAASTVLTSKTSRYRRVDLYPRQGQQFLEMFDANDGKLVGLFLFVGDDLASLVGLKGRRLEHALTTLLLQPVGDRWNSDAVYRISQILQTWFFPIYQVPLLLEGTLDATTNQPSSLKVIVDAPRPTLEALTIDSAELSAYPSLTWPEIGVRLYERCIQWLGVGHVRATDQAGRFTVSTAGE